jgi:Cu-Zn family superoxide dismutase
MRDVALVLRLTVTATVLSVTAACGGGGKGAGRPAGVESHAPAPKPTREEAAAPAAGELQVAVAALSPLGGSGVTGTVTFREEPGGGVFIEAHVNGLSAGAHGFHVHEWGDCSAADGSSAGGHFNPDAAEHAGPDHPMPHVGDMGNLTADASGHAMLTLISRRMTIGEGPNDVLGRAVIVHANADDLSTQPTGNSGGRIACGIIALKDQPAQPVLKPQE